MRRVLNLELLEKETLLSMAPMREVPAKAGNLSAIHAKLRSVADRIAGTSGVDCIRLALYKCHLGRLGLLMQISCSTTPYR
jgi:hypothetical protein